MKDDPCFTCNLPDCDETSRGCAVRQLNCSYSAKIKAGRHDEIRRSEREAQNEVFSWWHLERMAQAAEGVRPYKRFDRQAGGGAL
ncbi:hypothetical protein [Oricola sp.]|uniref:hypothetical protein n=1 Tax=Oricola sp. TaxID=1979950 RepID=UPI0025E2E3E9|nr:hypothetical protein [Oricola sp.]MCI5075663.1 hypothetical protein [Oricola sp.]